MKRTHLFLTIGLFASLFLFTSCEKEIEVNLPDYQSKVVIEGAIEVGETAKVTITRSTDYFQSYDSATIANIFVTNAVVTVTNQSGVTDTLHLMYDLTQPLPLVYKGSTLVGAFGETYLLKVAVNGEVYQSSTKILPVVPVDSLFFVEQDEIKHSGIIRLKYSDPAGVNNYYRVYSKVLGRDPAFIPVWRGATFDDRLISGVTTYGDVYRGDRSNLMKDTATGERMLNSHYFFPGDTVVVKWCSIDYDTYRFWYSAEMEMNSSGNPFMTPSPIVSNIPRALGVWGGYGAVLDTIVVPGLPKK